MEEKSLNPLSVVSLVSGILALLSNIPCCCVGTCTPLLSFLVGIVIVFLGVVAIATGFIANSQKEDGESEPLALAGIALGGVAIAISLVFAVLAFGGMALAFVVAILNG